MPKRRSHTNSHHGCRRCKQKKVKCDEGHPSCARCLSKGEKCEYNQLVQRHFTVVNDKLMSSRKPSNKDATKKSPASKSPSPPIPSPTADMAISSKGIKPLVRNDLEDRIYKHFLSLGPFPRPAAHNPLKTGEHGNFFVNAVKRNMTEHEFLLNGVYGFSALHLAMSEANGRRDLLNSALSYQNQAMELFRPLLHRVTRENAEALIVFSSVLSMCALATPVVTERLATPLGRDEDSSKYNDEKEAQPTTNVLPPPSDVLPQLIKVIRLFRGTKALITMAAHVSNVPTITEFWRDRVLTTPEITFPEAEASLDRVQETVDECIADPYLHRVYSDAIEPLRHTLKRSRAVPNAPYIVFVWNGMVSEEFVTQFEAGSPMAMVIVAHWAVTLHKLTAHFWAHSWGAWVILTVLRSIDESWHPLLYWPLQAVGVQPEELGVFPPQPQASPFDETLLDPSLGYWGTIGPMPEFHGQDLHSDFSYPSLDNMMM